jgi:hypothetical protein
MKQFVGAFRESHRRRVVSLATLVLVVLASMAAAATRPTAPPTLFGVSPSSARPGATVVLTLRGQGLTGVTAVQALRDGLSDAFVTTASYHSNADGTLTCTIVVGQSAAPGPRILQVVTRGGRSAGFDTGTNRFTVEP